MGNGNGGGDMGNSVGNVSLLNRDGNSNVLCQGGGEGLGDLLDSVGAGLVDQGLVDGLVSPHGAGDLLGSVGGDVLEDGLGNVVGLDNGGGLVGGNGGGDVGVGGLSYGVGQGGDLGDDLSEGMSLSGGVSKVSSKSVVLDGSRVVSWGTDKVGGCVTHNGGAGAAVSNQGGEEQEGIHGGSC